MVARGFIAAGALGLFFVSWGLAGVAQRAVPADEVSVTASRYSPATHIEAASSEVQVEARVWDDRHRAVAGLGVGDFVVTDNGKPQAITGFSAVGRAAPLGLPEAGCPGLSSPRSVIVFFDDVSTGSNDLAYARNQAMEYLGQSACEGQLPGGEMVGLATSSGFDNLPFTGDARTLASALPKILPRPLSLGGMQCPLITPYQAWEIVHAGAASDAAGLAIAQALRCHTCPRDCSTYIQLQAEEVWSEAEGEASQILSLLQNAVATLARRPGGRTLVLASSGFLTQDYVLQQRQQALIDAALRAGVVIDSLDARGLTAPSPNMGAWNDPYLGEPGLDDWRLSQDAGRFSAGDSAMWEIAESTGGDFFADSNDLRTAFARDIAGPPALYTLSFARPDRKTDGAFHRIQVKVTAPGSYSTAARYGYFAPVPDPSRLTTAQWQTIERAVEGTETAHPIDVEITGARAPGGMHVGLRVNPHTLGLHKQDGRHQGHLTAVVALFSTAGHFVTGEQMEVAMRFRDNTFREVSRPGVGIPIGVDLKAAAGDYRLRVVLFDSGGGALTAMTGHLAIPPQR